MKLNELLTKVQPPKTDTKTDGQERYVLVREAVDKPNNLRLSLLVCPPPAQGVILFPESVDYAWDFQDKKLRKIACHSWLHDFLDPQEYTDEVINHLLSPFEGKDGLVILAAHEERGILVVTREWKYPSSTYLYVPEFQLLM